MPRNVKADALQRELSKLIARGAEGFKIIAESMTQPLRRYQDYQSVGREAVSVQTLSQGEDPLVDTDVSGGIAYFVSEMGSDISRVINPETVRFNTSAIASNPKITYKQIASRKYDIKSRVQKFTEAEVFRLEDRMIFQGLLAVSTHEYAPPIFQTDPENRNPFSILDGKKVTIPGDPANPPIVAQRSTVGLKDISSAIALIERHGGLKPTKIFMNGANLQILRDINNNGANGYFVDFETSKEIMNFGYIGTVYGLTLFVSPEVPSDRIIITAEPEFTGRLVEAIPLTVIPYEKPEDRQTGFSIFEDVGVFFHNPNAVSCIKLQN